MSASLQTPFTVKPRKLEAFSGRRAIRSAKIEATIFWAAIGILLAAPLAFGAVEPWSRFSLELSSGFLAACLLIRRAGQRFEARPNPLFFPMLAFAVVAIGQLVLSRSSYAYQTKSQILLYTAYASLCYVVTTLCNSAARVKKLAIVMSSYGAGVAVFALAQNLVAPGKLYWVKVPASGGWVYGPYVNHNHYAGLMELLFPIAVVAAISHYTPPDKKLMFALGAAVMGATVFLSGSRGGMVALAGEIALLMAIFLRNRVRKPTLILAAGVILATVVAAWMGGAEVRARFASLEDHASGDVSGSTRMAIYRDSIAMFKERPILGFGLGNFASAYPRFQSFYLNAEVNAAHNDYLQFLVDMGAIGGLVALWFVVVLSRSAWRNIRQWPATLQSTTALGCGLGVAGILVHSFTDFNLQIPANAALFYVLACLSASHVEIRRGEHRKRIKG